jgi:hypothetical protein
MTPTVMLFYTEIFVVQYLVMTFHGILIAFMSLIVLQ